jgi:uncharacterized membrane protein
MEYKIAGAFSLIGALALLGSWGIFLFSAHPESANSVQLAIKYATYALTPSESGTWLFIFTLVSAFTCLTTSFILFFCQKKKLAMYVSLLHSVLGVFVYTWTLVLVIALPLVYFKKVGNHA